MISLKHRDREERSRRTRRVAGTSGSGQDLFLPEIRLTAAGPLIILVCGFAGSDMAKVSAVIATISLPFARNDTGAPVDWAWPRIASIDSMLQASAGVLLDISRSSEYVDHLVLANEDKDIHFV